jgi:hypothetical protein
LCPPFVVCYSTGMSEQGVRCGKCKGRHENVAAVRGCYRVAGAFRPAQAAQEAPAAPAPLEPGFYSSGPATFRLDAAGQWFRLSAKGRFFPVDRAPYRPWRMSVEDVAAVGRIMVRCVVCGTPLRKKESREAGIGPVCAGKV